MKNGKRSYIGKGTSYSLLVVFAALTIVGFAFVPLLSVNLAPSTYLPSITVSCRWNNASPITVENEMTSLLEGSLNAMGGIEKIISVSSNGRAKITLSFDGHTDIDLVRLETASIIRRIFPALPDGASYPSIALNQPDDLKEKPLLSYTLSGPGDAWQIQSFADDHIRKQLSLIDGIEKTEIYGATPYEWQISYMPDKMEALGLGQDILLNALHNYFHEESLGTAIKTVETDELTSVNQLPVKIVSPSNSETDWKTIPITKIGNRIVYLADIAKMEKKEQKPNAYFRINGQNAINIVVYPEKGANTLMTAAKVKKAAIAIMGQLPLQYRLSNNYDSTIFVKDELQKIIGRTIFTILILLLFVLLVSVSFRYLLIILLSIVVNISLSFILYYFFKIDIHLYSLAGITISFGLIIDNTIVMVDHIKHKHNIRVFVPLLASTLTTMAALSFIFFLPDEIRLNLWDFASIIIINLSVSLAVSLWFIPSLLIFFPVKQKFSRRLYKRKKIILLLNMHYATIITLLQKHKAIAITVAVLLFGLPVFMLPNSMEDDRWYAVAYNNTLGSEWYVDNAKPVVNKLLGGSMRLFSYYVFENSYYTKPEKTALYVYASLPKGSTIEQANNVFVKLEGYLKQFNETDQFITKIYGPQYAEITISFKKEFEDGSFPYLLKSRLISRSLDLGGINWNIYGIGKGFSNYTGANEMVNYKVALYGYNFDELENQASRLKEKLLRNPRVRNVNTAAGRYWYGREKSYEYTIAPDKQLLEHHGISLQDMYSRTKQFDFNRGTVLNAITDNGIEQIRVMPHLPRNMDIWNIFNLPYGARQLKLNAVSEITKETETQSIYKENQNYIRLVDFQYLGSSKFGNRHLETVLGEIREEMPMGYAVKSLSHGYLFNKESEQYELILLLIILLVFFICAVLFESLKQPLAIIFVIPLSFTGIFLTFYLFDFNFDQGGWAAFVLLSGLVVNSAIYIVNEYNNIKKANRKLPDQKRYIKAFNSKIVPILLTILSTILGLTPFVVYGQNDVFWFALAAGTIGGLLYSLIIIVLFLPLFIIKKTD